MCSFLFISSPKINRLDRRRLLAWYYPRLHASLVGIVRWFRALPGRNHRIWTSGFPVPYFRCAMATFNCSIHMSTIPSNSANPFITGTDSMPALANWLFHESGSSPAMSFMA